MMKLESSIKLSLAEMMSITTSSSNKVAANDTGRSALSGEFCVTGEESALHFNPFSALSREAGFARNNNMEGNVCVEPVGARGRPVCPVCRMCPWVKDHNHVFVKEWGAKGGCPNLHFTGDAWNVLVSRDRRCKPCKKAREMAMWESAKTSPSPSWIFPKMCKDCTKWEQECHDPMRCKTCRVYGKQLLMEVTQFYETKMLADRQAAEEKRLREEKAAEEERCRKATLERLAETRKRKAILERLVAIRKEKADLEAMLHQAHFETGFKQVVGAIRHYNTVLVRTMADAAVEATKLSGSIKRSDERKRKLDQFWRKTRTSLGVCPTGVLAVDELGKLTLVAARRAIMESCLPCKLADDAELALDRFVVVQPEAKLVREVEALVLSDDDSSDDEKKNDWTEVHRKTPKSNPKKCRPLEKKDLSSLSKVRTMYDLTNVMNKLNLSFADNELSNNVPCGRTYADPCQTASCRGHQSGCFNLFHDRTTTICLHDIQWMLGAKSGPCERRCNCGKLDCECRWRVHAQRGFVIAPCARGTKPGPSEKVVGPCTYLHPFAELGCDKLRMFREEPDGSHVEEALPVLLALEIYQRQQDKEAQKQREEAQKTPVVEQKNQSRPKRRPRKYRCNKQSDVEKGSIFDTCHAKVVRKKLENKSNISPEKELYLRKKEEEKLATQEKLQQSFRELKAKHARGEHLTPDECTMIRVSFRNSYYDDLSSTSDDEEEDEVEDDEKVVEDTVLPLFVVVRLRALARAARQHVDKDQKDVARQMEDLERKLAEVADRDVTWYVASGGKRSKRRHRRSQKKRSMGLNEFFQDDQPPTLSLRVVLRLRARLRTIRREMQVAQEEERERLRKRNEKFDR